MGKPIEQKVQKAVRSVIQKVILNISIIAIFVSLAVIALAYMGLDFSLAGGIVLKVMVPSIILTISTLIIYELWLRNGAESARSEKEYQDLLSHYDVKSKNISEDILQEFLDAEKDRRYKVEESRLDKAIEKITKTLNTVNNKVRQKRLNRKLKILLKHKDNIDISLPFSRSEQFDELRYTIKDNKFKEYKPNDTQIYLTKQRLKKYTTAISFTLIGINIISVSVSSSNWLVALFMTAIAAISLIAALIAGFNVGYTSISVYNTGVYKTAINFIDKAQAYCLKYNKSLYYVAKEQTDDIPELLTKSTETQETLEQEIGKNLFTRAAEEVTKRQIS